MQHHETSVSVHNDMFNHCAADLQNQNQINLAKYAFTYKEFHSGYWHTVKEQWTQP